VFDYCIIVVGTLSFRYVPITCALYVCHATRISGDNFAPLLKKLCQRLIFILFYFILFFSVLLSLFSKLIREIARSELPLARHRILQGKIKRFLKNSFAPL